MLDKYEWFQVRSYPSLHNKFSSSLPQLFIWSVIAFDERLFNLPNFTHSPINKKRPLVLSSPGISPNIEVMFSVITSKQLNYNLL